MHARTLCTLPSTDADDRPPSSLNVTSQLHCLLASFALERPSGHLKVRRKHGKVPQGGAHSPSEAITYVGQQSERQVEATCLFPSSMLNYIYIYDYIYIVPLGLKRYSRPMSWRLCPLKSPRKLTPWAELSADRFHNPSPSLTGLGHELK